MEQSLSILFLTFLPTETYLTFSISLSYFLTFFLLFCCIETGLETPLEKYKFLFSESTKKIVIDGIVGNGYYYLTGFGSTICSHPRIHSSTKLRKYIAGSSLSPKYLPFLEHIPT